MLANGRVTFCPVIPTSTEHRGPFSQDRSASDIANSLPSASDSRKDASGWRSDQARSVMDALISTVLAASTTIELITSDACGNLMCTASVGVKSAYRKGI